MYIVLFYKHVSDALWTNLEQWNYACLFKIFSMKTTIGYNANTHIRAYVNKQSFSSSTTTLSIL